MRVICIGGGPAGLYLGALLKKADPTHEVAIYERNRPTDTFGFGVVFSDATLGNLAAADAETFEAIRQSFAHWDDIDTHVGGQVIRSVGHGFCGLERKRLLEILIERCTALGVELHFETEIESLQQVAGEADLIVGADGVQSMVRTQLAEHFGPEIDESPNRFVWLGTTFPFAAFTFYFKENKHGLWRVHAYRYAQGDEAAPSSESTFIVECTAETFARAGLEGATEDETIDYLQEVFAQELAGHRLIKNRSIWRRFPTIRNRRWHHGNVVLVGDAAHTAHFSIGSGTKLAMEDCIALVDALGRTPDVPAALELYERERRPEVESLQRAAEVSLEWFHNTERYMSLEPIQFTFSLLTRSLRVTHEGLRVRDPALVGQVDGWFARRAHEQCGSPAPATGEPPPPMFTPFRLRDLVLGNRVIAAPVAVDPAAHAEVADWALVHVGARALGGAGLVMTQMIEPHGDPWVWKRCVDFVHEHSGARIGVRVALLATSGAQVSASDIATAQAGLLAVVRELDRVGFDLLEIDLSAGVAHALLSPLTNHRTDELGGGLQGRMRVPLALVAAAREIWPAHKPVGARLCASEHTPGGFEGTEVVHLAAQLRERGCDIVSVTTHDPPTRHRLFQIEHSDRIRQEAGIPTIAEGSISSYQDINSVLAAGRADLCSLGRALMFDPHFVRRAAHAQNHPLPWPPVYHLVRKFEPRS